MPLYPVQEGHTYTIGDKVYVAGEVVDLTEGQAAPWVGFVLGEAVKHRVTTNSVSKAKKQTEEVSADGR